MLSLADLAYRLFRSKINASSLKCMLALSLAIPSGPSVRSEMN